MAKYKPLNIEELQSLEKEFVEFLVINGMMQDDWIKMKDEDPIGAQKMTELFSDVVWESILRNTKYIDFRSAHSIKCFQCLDDKIILVGLDSSETDMSTSVFAALQTQDFPDDVAAFTTEKKYNKVRELEIFEMLDWGCEISEGQLFRELCLAL
ncbi:DUF6495 family protein [Saprospiraceae bacterium]|nr:DUF6495 family protein [Saprospiraceae bacterium]